MTKAIQREALTKAVSGQSFMNYQAIVSGFETLGIPLKEIKPRENVFTFHAWRALGRCVKKGEHGVRICTFIRRKDKTDEASPDAPQSGRTKPWHTTVFHISQTQSITDGAEVHHE
jgi:antirestriction protein ArdC